MTKIAETKATTYKNFEDIPSDALEELKYEALNTDDFFQEIDSIDNIIHFLKDINDYSGDYVGREPSGDMYSYSLTTKTYKFEAIGRCYIKSGGSCVCPEEMDESINITVIKDELELKKANNSNKWDKLIGIGVDECITQSLLDKLKQYKCPDEKI